MTRDQLIENTATTLQQLNVEIQAAIVDRKPSDAALYAEALREAAIAYRELAAEDD